jgi:hypothetical protein
MRRQNRHVLLLCDNASSHKHNPADYPNVHVEYLASNLTAWVQPMDAGIIGAFKSQYRRRFMRMAIRRDDEGVANLYKINQLEAMQIASEAWDAVTPTTIYNCWRHSGIVPDTATYLPAPPPVFDDFHAMVDDMGLMRGHTHPEVFNMLTELHQNLPTEQELTDGEIFARVTHKCSA